MRNGECRAGMLLLLAWTDLLFSLQQPVSSDAGCLVLRGGFKRGWKGHDPITKTLIRPKVSRTKRMQKELAEIEYYHEYVHKSREAERLRGQVMEMSDQLFELKEGRTGGHGNLTYNQSAEARSLYLSTLQSLVGQGSSPQGGIQASALNRRQDELLAEPTIQRKRVYKEKVSSSKKKRLAYPSQNSSRRMDADGRLIAKDSVWAKIVSRLKDKIARLCGSSFPTQHASHQTTVVCISDERLKEITSQAAAGSLDAQVELGEMYVNGSLPSDPMKAVACFMKGVDERHPPAMFNMAKCFAGGVGIEADPRQAFQLWYEASDLGHSVSFYELGHCYLRGFGVPKDEQLALEAFIKGGELEDPRCQYNAGFMLVMGWGRGTSDRKEALRWLKRAASVGMPEAQFFYAVLGLRSEDASESAHSSPFPTSWTVKEDNSTSDLYLDLSQSIKLLRRAALQGHVEAMNHLALSYLQGSPPPKLPLKAMRWWKKAAKLGSTSAMCNLVKGHFENHFEDKSNVANAIKTCRKAAKLGDPNAIFMLSGFYRTGVKHYVKQDPQVAFRLLKKSASLGHSLSLYVIGKAYCKGWGTDVDYKQGFRSFLKAAREGFIPAMFQVSKCYSIGMGVGINDLDSEKWLERAVFHSQKSSTVESKNPLCHWRIKEDAERYEASFDYQLRVDQSSSEDIEYDDPKAQEEKLEAWKQMATPEQVKMYYEIETNLQEFSQRL